MRRPGSFAAATRAFLRGLCALTLITLASAPARADVDPARPLPCSGDACDGVPPEARQPLLVAGDPTQQPQQPPPPPSSRPRRAASQVVGPRFSFGRNFTLGIADGFYGRIDTEMFELAGPGIFGRSGPLLLGLKIGLEGWGSVDGGGGGIPWGFELGAAFPFGDTSRSARFLITGTLGWEWAHYDRTRHVGQFGIFAPLAEAHLGFDFRGVRLFADASAQYRWGWGDADRSQIRAGASLSINSELWNRR